MTETPKIVAVASALLIGLAGCHLVPDVVSANLRPGPGRVERALPAGVEPTFRATLAALDDLGVRPEEVDFHDARQEMPLEWYPWEGEAARTNLDVLGMGENLTRDLFDRHQLKIPADMPGQPATPQDFHFDPMAMEYHGKAADGRAVHVVARAKRYGRPDDTSDAETTVQARIGPMGDEAWGRSFLDGVAAHLDQDKSKAATSADAKSTQEAH